MGETPAAPTVRGPYSCVSPVLRITKPSGLVTTMDGARQKRVSLKTRSPEWKEKLLRNCLERAKEERSHLIWKIRLSVQSENQKDIVESTFRDIVSEEFRKIEESSYIEKGEVHAINVDDLLWEYNDLQMSSSPKHSEYEELLIEMERLLYEDLRKELIRRELDAMEEEDEYLARAVDEQIQLNDKQSVKDDRLWCPVCKQGQLRVDCRLVYCTGCNLQLDLENDKANLDVLRERLAAVYEEHLDSGCKAAPGFCLESRFKITALYIQCHVCQTFEVVL